MEEELLGKYIAQIGVKPHNTKGLFMIGIVGLVGSGKSTVAHAIANETGVYVASNDDIRRFLNAQGFEGDAPVQETLQFIAESTTNYMLKNQISHIIDADLLKFHELARAKAAANDARFYLIEVTCPEDIIRSRIEKRLQETSSGNSTNLSRANIEEFERRKAIHAETAKPAYDFTIHSDQDLEPQVQRFVERLKTDGVY